MNGLKGLDVRDFDLPGYNTKKLDAEKEDLPGNIQRNHTFDHI